MIRSHTTSWVSHCCGICQVHQHCVCYSDINVTLTLTPQVLTMVEVKTDNSILWGSLSLTLLSGGWGGLSSSRMEFNSRLWRCGFAIWSHLGISLHWLLLPIMTPRFFFQEMRRRLTPSHSPQLSVTIQLSDEGRRLVAEHSITPIKAHHQTAVCKQCPYFFFFFAG